MSLDEQLRRAFDTLNDRLRDALVREADTLAAELAAAAQEERAAAATEIAARARDEATAAAREEARQEAERAAERLAAAVAAARDEARRDADEAIRQLRDDADRALEQMRQETDHAILQARDEAERVAQQAREEAERVARQAREEADRAAARLAEEVAAAEARGRSADEARAAAERAAREEHEAALQAARDERDAAIAAARDEQSAAIAAAREDAAVAIAAARAETIAATRHELNAAEADAGERLVEAVRAIDRARSLSEVLDGLVSYAGREASRVGMLLVRGGRLHGWRFIGFGPKLDEASQVELAFTDSGIVGDAVRTVTLAQLENGSGAAPPFAKLPQSARAIAFPIAMSDQVVAVLYADDSAEPRHVAWATAIEVMGRHAARRLEALTAFSAARALTERGGRDAQPASIDPGGQSADEEHEAARRYARLLISEIKLYHEPAVAEGRRERDLATRLGGEIARARVLYDQRVPARLRGSTDYFQAELVRTLANGDASLLGRLKAGAP